MGNDFSISRADRLVEGGVLFLLVFTPLAFGAVHPWSEAVVELTVLAMAVAWLLGMVASWELRVAFPVGSVPAVLFLALVTIQVVPLPTPMTVWLSPLAVAWSREGAAYVGGMSTLVPMSLAPSATWREAMRLAAVAGFALVVYNVFRTREQARRALWTMILAGAAVALLGVVQRVTWTGRLYWIGPEATNGSPFGPFMNRAHFAGLMVVVVPLTIALLLSGRRAPARRRRLRTWRERLRLWNTREAGPTRVLPLLALLMTGAALASGSRGGMVSLAATLLVMAWLGTRGLRWGARLGVVSLTTMLLLAAGLWLGSDYLFGSVERLAEEVTRREESPRLLIWADALSLWRMAPLLGTGLGSFEWVFPQVRTIRAALTYTHAESDWVQILTDTGVAGLALVLAVVISVGSALARRLRTQVGGLRRALALGGLTALTGTAIQTFGNYSLPVTANLLYLAVAITIGLAASVELPGERDDRKTQAEPAA